MGDSAKSARGSGERCAAVAARVVATAAGAARAAVAIAAIAACEKPGGAYGTTRPRHGPDEYWLNNGGEPDYLDPGRATSSNASSILRNIFEGLVRPHPETVLAEPGVAERWDMSEDRRTYTFHLRPDARWSDGRPVTAHDFVWAWRRVLDPATGSKYASQMFAIENGEAVFGGKLGPDRLGVRALDDRTLEVRLRDPIPYFLSMLAIMVTPYPLRRDVVEPWDRSEHRERWTQPDLLVSNGPYVLREWHFRHKLVFEKNPHYWDRDRVRVDRIVTYEVESYTTTLDLYKTGWLDDIGENTSITPEFMDLLSTKKDYIRAPYIGVYFYWVNTRAPPLDDVRVRRALNLAIDKRSICAHVARAGQQPALALNPPGIGGYMPPPGEPYDPDRARALLAEAGYPGGKGFPGFTVIYNTSEGHKLIAEAVQQMWKKTLGIDVAIENQEWQVYLKHVDAMDFQVARMGWIGDYPDPFTFLELLHSASGNNHSGWKDPTYDRMLDEANGQTDPERRFALFREAEAYLLERMPLLPIYVYTRSSMVKPYVRGWHPNIQDIHPWRALSIDLDPAR